MIKVKFLNLGDKVISVEFGNEISVEINTKAGAFVKMLDEANIPGITEVALSYRAAAVNYDPMLINYDTLIEICRPLAEKAAQLSIEGSNAIVDKVIEVPILYGGGECEDEIAAQDMKSICEHEGKTRDEIIKIHTENMSRVFQIGFMPGYAYTSSQNGFTIPRLPSPRTNVPAGAVHVCQNQTTILPNMSPAGWYRIGHSPIKLTDLESDTPFLFSPGVWAKFVAITKTEYNEIKKQVELRTYVPKIYNMEVK